MQSRRAMLQRMGRAGFGAAVGNSCLPLLAMQAPSTATSATTADEMTINSAPQQALKAGPSTPLPSTVPPESLRESGRNSLRVHGEKHGLLVGAAVVVKALMADPALQQLITEQYDILVPESELKWRALRPSMDRFDFTQSDALFAFAKQHRLKVRGHTMVWHNSVPDWLTNSPASLDVRALLVLHIQTVLGRYKGRVQAWDVVNEAILPSDGQPGGLRKSFWFERLGPDYIELAFRTARKADPHAKLTYNDYGVEYDSPEDEARRMAILALLRGLLDREVPLDAVGIQSHIKAGSPFAFGRGLAGYIESIRQMGLEVYLTELDINEDDLKYDDVARRDETIAATYSDFLTIALANPAVTAMLTWGISDRRTWLNDGPTHRSKQPNRPQRALPFDDRYRPTPAFFAIRDCFDHRAPCDGTRRHPCASS